MSMINTNALSPLGTPTKGGDGTPPPVSADPAEFLPDLAAVTPQPADDSADDSADAVLAAADALFAGSGPDDAISAVSAAIDAIPDMVTPAGPAAIDAIPDMVTPAGPAADSESESDSDDDKPFVIPARTPGNTTTPTKKGSSTGGAPARAKKKKATKTSPASSAGKKPRRTKGPKQTGLQVALARSNNASHRVVSSTGEIAVPETMYDRYDGNLTALLTAFAAVMAIKPETTVYPNDFAYMEELERSHATAQFDKTCYWKLGLGEGARVLYTPAVVKARLEELEEGEGVEVPSKAVDADHIFDALAPEPLTAIIAAFKESGFEVQAGLKAVPTGTGKEKKTVFRVRVTVKAKFIPGSKPVPLADLVNKTDPAVRMEAWAALVATQDDVQLSLAAMVVLWTHHMQDVENPVTVNQKSGSEHGIRAVTHWIKTASVANPDFVSEHMTEASTREAVTTKFYELLRDRLTTNAVAMTSGLKHVGLRNGFDIPELLGALLAATAAHHTPGTAGKFLGAAAKLADALALNHHKERLEDELEAMRARIEELERQVEAMKKQEKFNQGVLGRKAKAVEELRQGAELETDAGTRALKLAEAAAAEADLKTQQMVNQAAQENLAKMEQTLANTVAQFETRSGRISRRPNRLIEDDGDGAGPADPTPKQVRTRAPAQKRGRDTDDGAGPADSTRKRPRDTEAGSSPATPIELSDSEAEPEPESDVDLNDDSDLQPAF